MVCCRIFSGILFLLISQTQGLFSQETVLIPPTPAYARLQTPVTFQCKISIRTDWRSTLFYDQTYSNGVPSVALFNRAPDGTRSVNSVSNIKYDASCDASGGVFNLTIRSVEAWYHNQYVRCRVQFGNGTSTDFYTTANSTIYVRINISTVIVSINNVTSDVNSNVDIQCNVTSRPAAIVQWFKTDSDGKISDVTSSSSYIVSGDIFGDTVSSDLFFKFTQLDNQGNLYCKANNTISSQNSSFISLNIQYPPTADPSIQQTPLGAIITGGNVVLTCSLSGGNPIATLLWNCSGNMTEFTQGSTVINRLTFIVDKHYNGQVCSCLATHNVSSYRRSVQVKLVVNYPPNDTPSIIQTPVGAIITGTPVLLTCLLTGGNPIASLSWNCTGTVRPNSTETTASISIEFTVSRQNHGVVCSCFATHSAENYKQTAHHLLDVIYPPDDIPVTKQSQPGPIDTQSSVVLICSVAGGNPLPSLSWDCPGITSYNASDSTVISSTVITVDKNYNRRVCTCSASHRISTYRPTVQHELIVYYPPTKPTLKPEPPLPWFQGNMTTIECMSESGNPKSLFQWKRNAEKIMYNGTVLTLGPLTKEDNRIGVTCLVRNDYTERKGIILESESFILDVEYFPDVVLDTPQVYAVEGDNVTLTCNTTGNPTPKVQWLLEDKYITKVQSANSVLKIVGIDRISQKTRYTCKAWANSTKFGVLIKYNSPEIIVYYRPNITKVESINGLIVPENQSATLQCHVDSNPLSNITWFFEGNQVALHSENEVSISNVTLFSVQCYDTGVYRCVAAININGEIMMATKEVNLGIGCKPRINIQHTSLPSVIAVEGNSELNITVILIAWPPPVTQWIFNKVLKSTDISRGIQHSSTFFIANVSSGDFGDYTVYSWNDYGHLFINLRIAMKGPPNPPYDVVVFCKTQSIVIQWKPGFNGGDQQSFHIMYWNVDNDVVKTESDFMHDTGQLKTLEYVIKGVIPNTRYKLQVVASNSFGKTQALIMECTTDSIDKLDQQESNNEINIAGIVMISTGVLLAVSAVFIILCCARRCGKKSKEQSKSNDIGYIIPTNNSTSKHKLSDDTHTSDAGAYAYITSNATLDNQKQSSSHGSTTYITPTSGSSIRNTVSADIPLQPPCDIQHYESIRNTATSDAIMQSTIQDSTEYITLSTGGLSVPVDMNGKPPDDIQHYESMRRTNTPGYVDTHIISPEACTGPNSYINYDFCTTDEGVNESQSKQTAL